MEEKERYKIDKSTNCYTNTIVDTKTNTYYGNIEEHIDLLNQQEKEIKQLAELYYEINKKYCEQQDDLIIAKGENQQLKQQLAESERKLEEYKKCNCKECMTDYEKNLNQIIDKYLNENIKLKQQLHDLPKKIMGEIKEKQPSFTENSYGVTTKQGWDMCVEILETIWKSYGGEI